METSQKTAHQKHTNWRLYQNFMPICPVTKKCKFIVSLRKKHPLFGAILHPFGPGHPNFNTRVTWDLSSANMSAKFYSDVLRFAAVIPENPICSDYTVCLPACYAWQHTMRHQTSYRTCIHEVSTTWSQTSHAVKTKIPTDHSSAKNTTVNV